jgi:hypothetical protein
MRPCNPLCVPGVEPIVLARHLVVTGQRENVQVCDLRGRRSRATCFAGPVAEQGYAALGPVVEDCRYPRGPPPWFPHLARFEIGRPSLEVPLSIEIRNTAGRHERWRRTTEDGNQVEPDGRTLAIIVPRAIVQPANAFSMLAHCRNQYLINPECEPRS